MRYILPKLQYFFEIEHLWNSCDFRLALPASPIDLMNVNQVLRSELVEIVVLVHINK